MSNKYKGLVSSLIATIILLVGIAWYTNSHFSNGSYLAVSLFAILYGICMKIADLLDEHGMVWFKGSKLYYGVLWGGFGALLVLSNIAVANAILAMILAFLLRLRLDYRNHALAGVIIIIAFLAQSIFVPTVFFTFFLTLAIFGMLKDYLGDIRKKKDLLYKINEIAPYNMIVSFLYSSVSGNWLVFLAVFLSTIAYDAIKWGFYKLGYYQNI